MGAGGSLNTFTLGPSRRPRDTGCGSPQRVPILNGESSKATASLTPLVNSDLKFLISTPSDLHGCSSRWNAVIRLMRGAPRQAEP